jgi:hypothetical protein
LTTFTLFDLPAREWRRGLAQMRTTPPHLTRVPGLRFGRMLGSGVSFGLRPNLRRYGLLAEWEGPEAAHAFLRADPLLARFAARGFGPCRAARGSLVPRSSAPLLKTRNALRPGRG